MLRRLSSSLPLIFALLIQIWATACTTSAEPRCSSDSDCRNGFMCDLERFVGECVQIVEVEACGEALCTLPEERCVEGQCRAVTPQADAGLVDGGPLTDGGVIDVADAEPGPPPMPQLFIDSPAPDTRFIDARPVVTGTVINLVSSGRLYFILDDGVSGDLSPVDGRFEVALDLPLGIHDITIVAEQGTHRAEASVTFTLNGRVIRQGNRLTLGARPFRFLGFSAPGLLDGAWRDLYGDDDDEVAATFDAAKRLGVQVIRARAYDDRPEAPSVIQRRPGDLSEEGLVALDHLIAEAERRGLKLWLVLSTYDGIYGSVDQYLKWAGYMFPEVSDRNRFFEAGEIREGFKAYVQAIVDRTNSVTGVRYGDDPTIMGWELMEGLSARGVFDSAGAGAELLDFVSDVTRHLDGLTEDQLIAVGDEGQDVDPQPYGLLADGLESAGLSNLLDGTFSVSWRRHVGLGPVSLAGLHLRPALLGFPANDAGETLGSIWLSGHSRVAAQAGRPTLLLNVQVPSWDGLDLASRREMLTTWLDEVVRREWSGAFVGGFHPEGRGGDDPNRWGMRPGTRPDDPANVFADIVEAVAAELSL
ncbi:MAG: hypothetical protein ACE366_29045 [Bradymonadia bacterium]